MHSPLLHEISGEKLKASFNMQNVLGAWRMCAAGSHVSQAQRVSGNSGMPTFIPNPTSVLQLYDKNEFLEISAQNSERSPSGQDSVDRCPAGQLMTDDDQLKMRVHSTLQHIIRRESDEILSEWMASMMGNTVPCGAPLQRFPAPTSTILLSTVWSTTASYPVLPVSVDQPTRVLLLLLIPILSSERAILRNGPARSPTHYHPQPRASAAASQPHNSQTGFRS